MRWLGLTGGIASGKSTVSKILRDLGLPVVDADLLARKVVEPESPALKQIVIEFGQELLDPYGRLDRKTLGKIIFSDQQKRLKLESILHPEIQRLRGEERLRLEREGYKFAFYDVPLLFEKNMQEEFDATILVYCSDELQIQRLAKRDDISESEAAKILKSQMPIDEKKQLADFIIDNSSTIADLKLETHSLLSDLKVPVT